jgi:phosphatidylserine/phosphatidylglycerophosphate/cardiolipin synthase-like enzyme
MLFNTHHYKRLLCHLIVFGCLFSTLTACGKSARLATDCPILKVCFTPGQNCTETIVGHLNQAKQSIFVQAYSFTSAPIAKALMQAKKRGVAVKIILDKSQRTQKYSSLHFFLNQGIPVWIDTKPAIAHNKVMIIDQATVITGSFNFTKAAQMRNAENVLIIQDTPLAQQYLANWKARQQKSEVFKR